MMPIRMGLAMATLAFLCSAGSRAQGTREISGVVVNSRTGSPVAGAEMILMRTNDGKPAGRTQSDPAGHFAFSNLGDGKFALIARAKGYVPGAYQEHPPGVSTALVTGDALITTGLRFELAPLARISGSVQEDSGDPVPNARVSLYRRDAFIGTGIMSMVGSSQADAMGRFEFNRLPEGDYYACAFGTPWYAKFFQARQLPGAQQVSDRRRSVLDVAYAPTCYPDVTDSAAAEAIRIHPGDSPSLSITMHPEPAVHIVMQVPRADEKHPFIPPQFSTRIFGIEEQIQTPVGTSDGELPNGPARIEISGLTAGQYDVTILGANGEKNRETSADISPDHAELVLSAASPLPDLTGEVVTGTGESLRPGSHVLLRGHHAGYNVSARLQPDGTFTFSALRPDEYDITVMTPPQGRAAIASMAATGGGLTGHVLKVGHEPVKLAIVIGDAKATVNGIATRRGSPASGVFILLVPADSRLASELLETNQSDLDGTFDFPHVPAGTYTVVAVEQGWKLDWARPQVIAPFLPGGVKITVPAESREVNLPRNLEVQPIPQ